MIKVNRFPIFYEQMINTGFKVRRLHKTCTKRYEIRKEVVRDNRNIIFNKKPIFLCN